MSITPLYAGFFGILLVALSWRITAIRNKYQSRMTEEGHTEMTAATRAQGHLVEYLPTALVLMLLVELHEGSAFVLHALGLLLVAARLIHLKGLKEPSGKSVMRKLGTRLTWLQITLASLLCVAAAFGIIL